MRAAALGIVIFTLALTCAGASTAPTWHVNVQTYSLHEHTTETDLHNTTPGLGLIRRQNDWLAGVGVFRNSIGRWAGYGYLGWQYPFGETRAGPFRLGVIAGLTHNYLWNDGGIVPLGAAVLTVPVTPGVAVDLVGIPRIRNATYATLNLSLSWRFR